MDPSIGPYMPNKFVMGLIVILDKFLSNCPVKKVDYVNVLCVCACLTKTTIDPCCTVGVEKV